MNDCPIIINKKNEILLGHGAGGKLTQSLCESIFYPAFKNEFLDQRHDGALLEMKSARLAFSTDSYVVSPIFFPGGDIGKLSVIGTVNDLAMCGATPSYLSCGFILEEGFLIEDLKKIVGSMKTVADSLNVKIVTGDTKVVEKGKGDGLFINTSGIGWIAEGVNMGPKNIKPGDLVIVNGDIGRHGMAILSTREGLKFDSEIISDCGDLSFLVKALIKNKIDVHCLRDLTRGGLATNLRELAELSGVSIELNESEILVDEAVRGGCEILGIDPLYLACEGRMAIIVSANDKRLVLDVLLQHGVCAQVIGEVTHGEYPLILKNRYGTRRILESLLHETLPRIC